VTALLADLGALLDHVGERGLPLTDTGRLRIADVRAINARFAQPDQLDAKIGDRVFALRREDQAWRVHFLRLTAQAAGLLDARLGRVRRTARARAFARLAEDEAERRLFVAWWWKGAWDLLVAGGLDLWLEEDREATARALLELGTEPLTLERTGARLRAAIAPDSDRTHLALTDDAWGYAAWHALRPLVALGGCVETRAVEDFNGHRFEHLAALRVNERGAELLHAALDAQPAGTPRVRRGMASGWPVPRRARGRAKANATAAEDERHERIIAQHPGYQAVIDLGEDMAGDVNPRAHLVTHEAIEEQLAANDPPEARAAYDRLAALGHADHDIVHALADVLVREIWQAQHDHSSFDRVRYAVRLAALPEPLEEPEAAPRDLEPARLVRRDRRRLERLPRTAAAWEVDLAELPIEVERVGTLLCAIWGDATDGTIRAFYPEFDAGPTGLVLDSFLRAALRPQAGAPGLPAQVRAHAEIAAALRGMLGELGVAVEATDELPAVHLALDSFRQFIADGPASPDARHRRLN
jgi:hypothetical protein